MMKGIDVYWLDAMQWNNDGLIPVITQEAQTGEILMLAWMNQEALKETLRRGEVVYWSRSRQCLWHKGTISGHTQTVKDIRLDCDGDALLIKVHQNGSIACHTGRSSCFYRQLNRNSWVAVEPVIKNPETIYGKH